MFVLNLNKTTDLSVFFFIYFIFVLQQQQTSSNFHRKLPARHQIVHFKSLFAETKTTLKKNSAPAT